MDSVLDSDELMSPNSKKQSREEFMRILRTQILRRKAEFTLQKSLKLEETGTVASESKRASCEVGTNSKKVPYDHAAGSKNDTLPSRKNYHLHLSKSVRFSDSANEPRYGIGSSRQFGQWSERLRTLINNGMKNKCDDPVKAEYQSPGRSWLILKDPGYRRSTSLSPKSYPNLEYQPSSPRHFSKESSYSSVDSVSNTTSPTSTNRSSWSPTRRDPGEYSPLKYQDLVADVETSELASRLNQKTGERVVGMFGTNSPRSGIRSPSFGTQNGERTSPVASPRSSHARPGKSGANTSPIGGIGVRSKSPYASPRTSPVFNIDQSCHSKCLGSTTTRDKGRVKLDVRVSSESDSDYVDCLPTFHELANVLESLSPEKREHAIRHQIKEAEPNPQPRSSLRSSLNSIYRYIATDFLPAANSSDSGSTPNSSRQIDAGSSTDLKIEKSRTLLHQISQIRSHIQQQKSPVGSPPGTPSPLKISNPALRERLFHKYFKDKESWNFFMWNTVRALFSEDMNRNRGYGDSFNIQALPKKLWVLAANTCVWTWLTAAVGGYLISRPENTNQLLQVYGELVEYVRQNGELTQYGLPTL